MSDKNLTFAAQDRTEVGKNANRRLRKTKRVPAIVYGGPSKEVKLSISQNDFQKEYKKGGFMTRLVQLKLEGKEITAITRDIQFDPVTDAAVHLDFQEVTKGTEIKLDIAVRLINRNKCPGLKIGGVVNLVYRAIPFYCSPDKIPEHIDIDLTGMEIGANKHISDIALPEGIRPVNQDNFTVVSIGGSAADEDEDKGEEEEAEPKKEGK